MAKISVTEIIWVHLRRGKIFCNYCLFICSSDSINIHIDLIMALSVPGTDYEVNLAPN